jgi:hypothetical protein
MMNWCVALRSAGYQGDMTLKAVSEDCHRLRGSDPRREIACVLMMAESGRLCGGYLEDGIFKPSHEADTEQEAMTLLWAELRWKRDLIDAGYKGKLDPFSVMAACPAALRKYPDKPLIGLVLKRCEPVSPHWVAGYPDFLWGSPSILPGGALAGLWKSLAFYRKTA